MTKVAVASWPASRASLRTIEPTSLRPAGCGACGCGLATKAAAGNCLPPRPAWPGRPRPAPRGPGPACPRHVAGRPSTGDPGASFPSRGRFRSGWPTGPASAILRFRRSVALPGDVYRPTAFSSQPANCTSTLPLLGILDRVAHHGRGQARLLHVEGNVRREGLQRHADGRLRIAILDVSDRILAAKGDVGKARVIQGPHLLHRADILGAGRDLDGEALFQRRLRRDSSGDQGSSGWA